MQNPALRTPSTAQLSTVSLTPSKPSALSRLDRDYHSAPTNISLSEAQAALDFLNAVDLSPPSPAMAAKFLAMLKATCTLKQVESEDEAGMVLITIERAFLRFPAVFGEQVLDPVDGLPGTQKYPLRPNDVVEALKSIQARHDRCVGNAMWAIRFQKQEQERRAEDARREAERRSMTPEARKARMDAILAKAIRPMSEEAV